MSFTNESAKVGTDCRIKFRRPYDNSVYCIMAPATVAKHCKAKTLESFLAAQRDSGIVIRTTRD